MSPSLQNMTSTKQDLLLPNELPPFSPVVFAPQMKFPYAFETEYSRDPVRIRAIFDELVEKTKEMNLGKPQVPVAKRRARNLGLKVNIEQAKALHWRSIQARHPVVLTAGPFSPPRTPRRPATDYPTAEQLCLKNMADAQRKQNYPEACRWSIFAERERAISKWEAEQETAYRVQEALVQTSTGGQQIRSPLDRPRLSAVGYAELDPERPLTSASAPSNMPWIGKNSLPSMNPTRSGELQPQTVVEMPVHLMDRSQGSTPDGAGSYAFVSHDQMRSFNVPYMSHGTSPSISNLLARGSSIQRHLPATSLRMAPTPLRPRIDHQPIAYPTPQVTRLSYVQPVDAPASFSVHNSADVLGYPSVSGLSGLSSNQTTSIPSDAPDVLDQALVDDYSLKKRRSEAEHFASQKIEQRKLR